MIFHFQCPQQAQSGAHAVDISVGHIFYAQAPFQNGLNIHAANRSARMIRLIGMLIAAAILRVSANTLASRHLKRRPAIDPFAPVFIGHFG